MHLQNVQGSLSFDKRVKPWKHHLRHLPPHALSCYLTEHPPRCSSLGNRGPSEPAQAAVTKYRGLDGSWMYSSQFWGLGSWRSRYRQTWGLVRIRFLVHYRWPPLGGVLTRLKEQGSCLGVSFTRAQISRPCRPQIPPPPDTVPLGTGFHHMGFRRRQSYSNCYRLDFAVLERYINTSIKSPLFLCLSSCAQQRFLTLINVIAYYR